ncbi:hypothetical protein WS9_009980 [Paraclostridium sordellii 8483]|uniref:hypothetical protein n=1 Tax=Paraclostridium sordellii TaxID=1505 RepID=UPI0002E1E948|nr:hypothetical protein [Paeniclostridium sordellii]TAN66632.1 hypothetical protein WS9_009980 [Paeniclostridium sordellii 8483]
MIGSIKGNVIEIVKIANEICEERGLNIKDMLDTNDPNINTIFNEAVAKFEKENEEDEFGECKRCKSYEEKINDIEIYTEDKSKEWKNSTDLIKEGILMGLETAITKLK